MIKSKKYENGKLYLSGGMEKCLADDPLGGKWRDTLSKKLKPLGFCAINITELDVAYTKEHGELYHGYDDMLLKKSNIRRHFVYTDLELIKHNSDAIVLYYDESVRLGAGTISEAQVSYNLGLPIFIVNKFADDTEIPGWLLALSTKIFNSFDELLGYLVALPPKILIHDSYGNLHGGDHYLCSLCGDPFKKNKHHFVSKISPLYCSPCVSVVTTTHEQHYDRYTFFTDYLTND